MTRMNKNDRRKQLMKHALTLAERVGYMQVRRDALADAAGVATGLVNFYWDTMTQLKRAIMREAVHTENLVVIAQGLAMKDRQAMKAPPAVREAAARGLV